MMRSKTDFNHGSCSLSSVDCKISKSKMMGGGEVLSKYFNIGECPARK